MKYIIFTLGRLWKNRTWSPTRRKYKAMDKDWERQLVGRITRYL